MSPDLKNAPPIEKPDWAYLNQLPGWCSAEKAKALAAVVRDLRPRISVEIGVFGGRSLIALASAHARFAGGIVYGIDPWSAEEALASVQETEHRVWWAKLDYEQIYTGCLRAIAECGLSTHCAVLRTTSACAADDFTAVDLLHIDGNHSEEKSCSDAALWLPKLTPGGALFFDDVNWPSTARALQMVRTACTEIGSVNDCAIFLKN